MTKAQASSTELHGIQMLRAVAAIAVLCHHALQQSNGSIRSFSPDWLTTAGASGVDLFFVISGFIMLHVSFRADRATPSASDFLFRRATRIYPFYWLCCLGILAISAIGYRASHHFGASAILSSFLLFPGERLVVVSWTLIYEVYFYLLFAATLWISSMRASLLVTTAAIIAIYLLSGFVPTGEVAKFLASPLPIEFCMGMGVAYAYSAFARHGRPWPVTLPMALLALVLLVIAPLIVPHPNTNGLPPLLRAAAWGIPSVFVVAGFLNLGAPCNAAGRFWILLGDASYALYLSHVFVMIAYGRLIKISTVNLLPQLPVASVVVLISIAVGVAAHVLVEKPLLKLIRQLTHRQPGHASPA